MPGPAAAAPVLPPEDAPQQAPAITPPEPPAPITPQSKPLTGPQRGALDKLESRMAGIARAENVPADLIDEVMADLRRELEPQVGGLKGGASEIAQQLVEALDLRTLVQTSALKALDRQMADENFGASRTAAAARKVGRGAERTTEAKVAAPREDEDWRTVRLRAEKIVARDGEKAPAIYREIAAYSSSRGGSKEARAAQVAEQARLRKAEAEYVEKAKADEAKAAKRAEEDRPPTLRDILESNPAPEGRETLADYNMRMARIVNNAKQAGISDPFLDRLTSLGSKDGGITRAEKQLLELQEFKLRAATELKVMDAETKKLAGEVATDSAQRRAIAEFRALGSSGRQKARAEFDDAGAGPAAVDLSKLTPTRVVDLTSLTKDLPQRDLAQRAIMMRLNPNLEGVRVFFVPAGQLNGNDGLTTFRFENSAKPTVFIEEGLSQDRMIEVVLHEATHAATQVRLLHDKKLAARLEKLRQSVIQAMGYNPRNLPYELSNLDEFVAHAMTSQRFQGELARVRIPEALAQELGIKRSLTIWDGFVELLKRAFGISDFSALEATIRLGGSAFTPQSKQQEMIAQAAKLRAAPSDAAIKAGYQSILSSVTSHAYDVAEKAPDMLRSGDSKIRTMFLGFSTASDIVENYKHLFGWTPLAKASSKATAADPLTQVQNALARQGVRARELRDQAEPLVRALNQLARKSPQGSTEMQALMQEATALAVHPDVPLTHPKNKHLQGKDRTYWQARAAHKRLSREYNRLAQQYPEIPSIWKDMSDYFEKSHNEMSRMLVKNLLETRHYQLVREAHRAGSPLPAEPNFDAMTKRFMDKAQTPADTAWLGDTMVEHVTEVRRLAKVAGPYFPQRRFGDFVVTWKETGKDEHAFATEAAAQAFAEKSDLLVLGVETRKYDAAGKRLSAGDLADPNVVAAKTEYVVRVQDNGVEFFDSRSDAEARQRELATQKKHQLSGVERRRQPESVNIELLPEQLRGMVRSIGKMDLPEGQADLIQRAIEQAAMRLLPGTSAKSALLRRRNVRGASQDAVRATAAYANASSNFLAKLEYAPVVHAGMDGMATYIEEHRFDGTGKAIAQQEVLREMQARQRMDAMDLGGGSTASRIVRMLQSMAFVNFLASPAYTMINLLQQTLVTAPYLGARFGDVATAKAMASANSAIFGKVMMGGAKQFWQAAKSSGEIVDFLGIVRDQISKGNAADKADLLKMLKHLADNGLIDLSAGMELNRAGNPKITLAGKALQYTEDVARAMPAAAEVVNRAGSAIAAYRLARDQGKMDHAAAMDFALETVRKTQFDYTPANTARFMDARRSPILALAMTFRKYAQGMYMLLGRSLYVAFKGASPQERKIARKTLTRIMISHMVFAGALGLPLEPIKIALGIVALGLGEDEPWDYEREVRQGLADVLGVSMAEVVTRGLPRAFGADLSGRVGLDSMLSAKGLQDYKPKSVQTAMFELVGGAPASMLLQPFQALEHMRNDDPMRAAEMLVPKGVRDVIKATRFGDEGIRTQRGEQIDPGLHGGQLFLQALGIQPAVVAETYERRDAIKSAEKAITDARQRFMRQYADAAPAERQQIWSQIRDWNVDQNPAARLTMDQLIRSMQERRRRANEAKKPDAAGTFLPENRRYLYQEGAFANVR